MVLWLTVTEPAAWIPPAPYLPVELPEMVLELTVTLPSAWIPPPPTFPEIVLERTVTSAEPEIPLPEFPEIVLERSVNKPRARIPPPFLPAELREITVDSMLRVSCASTAPPSPATSPRSMSGPAG